ncbi:N-acetylmuramoyl-L-alanine amidase [Nocardiopsis salina]|uniref:N-acetylmuramoyl-L-alanine amidase n=1 Tax=Nocardiopsis salina TaxID=245836 RepID=UPI00034C85A8|nr:N-acetylmuramoyl-L-alanine amidase [Nocardiopsis salina]
MPEPDKLQWRSDLGWPAQSPADQADPKDGLVVHYDSADQGLADEEHSACESYWNSTRDFHTGPSRGWVDIGYCVDEATEILTEDGWRTFRELGADDLVLTLDHGTGLSQWQPVQAVNVFPAMPRTLVRMEGRDHSSLTTDQHRWPVERVGATAGPVDASATRHWATTATLDGTDRLVSAAPCADVPSEAKWTDSLVEAVAWYWAAPSPDGIDSGSAARIRAALYALADGPAHWSETREGDRSVFHVSEPITEVLERHAPARVPAPVFLRALTRAQLDLLLNTAEGLDTRPSRSSSQAIDAYQYAVALAGRSSTLQHGPGGHPAVRSAAETTVDVDGELSITREVHDGHIWCPTTPNGTWLARREGTVYFTGNSFMACAHGHVMEGRGLFRTQAAQPGGNTTHYSVTLATGPNDTITPEQINAVRQLREWLMEPESSIAGTVLGHRDFVSTSCPGDEAYGMVEDGTFTEDAEWE